MIACRFLMFAAPFLFAPVLLAPVLLVPVLLGQEEKATQAEKDPVILQTHHRELEKLTYRRGQKRVTLRGLVLAESNERVEFAEFVFPKNQPSYVRIHRLANGADLSVTRLDERQRRQLGTQMSKMLRNPARVRIEAGLLAEISLETLQQDGAKTFLYRCEWFELRSSLDEEVTRRCILRIEQAFRAFQNAFAKQTVAAEPLKIRIFGSMDEYQLAIRNLGLNLQNPACYLPEKNLILAGSQLDNYGKRLQEVRQRSERDRKSYMKANRDSKLRLAEHLDQLKKQGYKKEEILRENIAMRHVLQKEFDSSMKYLDGVEKRNLLIFDSVTQQMFSRLYHEAFHAYLENQLFPSRDYDLPVWLNEGFAQIFEDCQVDGETLRVDIPDRDRLLRLQRDLAGNQALNLSQILETGGAAFIHSKRRNDQSDRFYLYCWGLAHFLFCEDNLLSRETLAKYVDKQLADADPVQRFETLVGSDLATFQHRWVEAMLER